MRQPKSNPIIESLVSIKMGDNEWSWSHALAHALKLKKKESKCVWVHSVETVLPPYTELQFTDIREAVAFLSSHNTDRDTIVLMQGRHVITPREADSLNILTIPSPIKIIGISIKPDVFLEGGIVFKNGIGMCHLEHLTLHGARTFGVLGHSSFTMNDVIVVECAVGVMASGTGVVGRCNNLKVCNSMCSGVTVSVGASIILSGNTQVYKNGEGRSVTDYGLLISSTSTIQLVPPLTKEGVSINNADDRNCNRYDLVRYVGDNAGDSVGDDLVEMVHGVVEMGEPQVVLRL